MFKYSSITPVYVSDSDRMIFNIISNLNNPSFLPCSTSWRIRRVKILPHSLKSSPSWGTCLCTRSGSQGFSHWGEWSKDSIKKSFAATIFPEFDIGQCRMQGNTKLACRSRSAGRGFHNTTNRCRSNTFKLFNDSIDFNGVLTAKPSIRIFSNHFGELLVLSPTYSII